MIVYWLCIYKLKLKPFILFTLLKWVSCSYIQGSYHKIISKSKDETNTKCTAVNKRKNQNHFAADSLHNWNVNFHLVDNYSH